MHTLFAGCFDTLAGMKAMIAFTGFFMAVLALTASPGGVSTRKLLVDWCEKGVGRAERRESTGVALKRKRTVSID